MTPRPCNGASSRVLASMRREERDWTLDAVASFLGLGAHTTPLRWERGEASMRLVDLHALLGAVKLPTRVAMLRALLVGVEGVRVEAVELPGDEARVDRLGVRLARVVAVLSETGVEALADGRIDDRERGELLRLLDEVKRLVATYEAALGARAR